MRSAWRLAHRSLRAKPRRTALLAAAVALSALLIAAVATAMASIQGSLERRILAQIGDADVRIQAQGSGATIPEGWIDRAASWPGVTSVVGRLEQTMPLRATIELWRPIDTGEGPHRLQQVQTLVSALGNGIEPVGEQTVRPLTVLEGRLPTGEGEIALDELLAERLAGRRGSAGALGGAIQRQDVLLDRGELGLGSATLGAGEAERANGGVTVGVGATVEFLSGLLLRKATPLRVVGIIASPPLGGRPQAYMERRALAALVGSPGNVTSVDIVLDDHGRADSFAAARRAELAGQDAGRVLIQTTAKITSGFEQNTRASRIGLVFASLLSFLAASFIIATAMTVDVAERQRELAIIRCIGGSRRQLAAGQLAMGLMVSGLGAAVGAPLGVLACGLLFWVFRDALQSTLIIGWWPVVLAVGGSLMAGVIGALWPAWSASSTNPLRALSPRASAVSRRGLVAVTVLGLAGLGVQALVVGVPTQGSMVFWGYVSAGLPAMAAGYFVLGVAMSLLIAHLLGAPLSRALGLPPRLLRRTIAKTPYRFGFTAGAMMAGLALLVSIWSHGGAIARDFFGAFEFPDAFVSGPALTPEARAKLDAMDGVTGTCAISLHLIETDTFGVSGFTRYTSTFIAFEPEPFFELAELKWIEGSLEVALPKLVAGGAVIVAREFRVARGLGVGDTFVCYEDGQRHEFEIVGVVTSPGLDIVSKFFNIGEEYTQQALHAVFGSRDDLRDRFGSESINLIQIQLAEGVDDEAAVEAIRLELFPYGILDAGSGRAIKRQILEVFGGALTAFSAVAVCAMIVACFGVANLIMAGIDTRRFEFGVLRAVGAGPGVLLRLVLGEAVIIALAACVLGTAMGFQIAWAGRRMNRLLVGIDLDLLVPVTGMAIGWGAVMVITLLAALPAALAVMRSPPRELLAAR
jgi:putative ABC transport system permease protein